MEYIVLYCVVMSLTKHEKLHQNQIQYGYKASICMSSFAPPQYIIVPYMKDAIETGIKAARRESMELL